MPRWPIEIPDSRYFEKLIACREGCPVNTDARGYVQAVARGDYAEAYRIARGPNPFASICGRVCGAPCEAACRRGFIDKPVTIRAIKRATTERYGVEAPGDPADTLKFSTAPGSLEPEPREGKVAVVGAGVAGLTCAHDLARLGYRVTVFEADKEPGGMLRTGVPVFRMPPEAWRREIDAILALGIELRCGVRVGRDVTLPDLRGQGFAAVFLGVGLPKSRVLELPGRELGGIVSGLDLLRSFNLREKIPPLGRVVVIGGGNVAYDCARSAVRLAGTESVTMVCLEALDEMPADEIEIIEGEEEGIFLANRRGPVRFVGEEGEITGIETRKVSRVFDDEGGVAPEMTPGSEEVLDCDAIVIAVGQAGDTGVGAGLAALEFGRGGTIVADRESGATSIPWLFAAGDAALGPGLFIDAVGQAQRAARSIHEYLGGGADVGEKDARRAFVVEGIREGMRDDYMNLPRRLPAAADPAERTGRPDMQVELPYDDGTAREQGARCLRCEVETIFDGTKCILCGGCADVCPTFCLRLVAVRDLEPAVSGVSAIIKDEELCIRCGMCAERCPTDAVTMERLCGYEPWTPLPRDGEGVFLFEGKDDR